jgi:hypothetical protein
MRRTSWFALDARGGGDAFAAQEDVEGQERGGRLGRWRRRRCAGSRWVFFFFGEGGVVEAVDDDVEL